MSEIVGYISLFLLLVGFIIVVYLVSKSKKSEPFSDRNIECSHAPYGSSFDYIKQKKERLYGVPLCCQNIF